MNKKKKKKKEKKKEESLKKSVVGRCNIYLFIRYVYSLNFYLLFEYIANNATKTE
jgi:hypothetical protein